MYVCTSILLRCCVKEGMIRVKKQNFPFWILCCSLGRSGTDIVVVGIHKDILPSISMYQIIKDTGHIISHFFI